MNDMNLSTKVSLINNYIQSNYLKSRGKSEHDETLVSDILNAIKEDLETLETKKNTKRIPLDSVLNDLRLFKEEQSKFNLSSVITNLQEIQEIQTNPENNLDSIISTLESIHRSE